MPLPTANLLSQESSPYLRQHQANPVHWRPWSPASLAEARELGKPILLSVGYAACHWCHVMAHESFENDEIAALMNRLYVNIKVDREERPDIDQIYMAALTATGEQGGWPLTMFLTPDAKPFWGGTYFPPKSRFGRPGFADVLVSVHRTWSEKQESINHSAQALTEHVRQQLAPAGGAASFSPTDLSELARRVFALIDSEKGGLRGAPKFPNAPFMHTLWLDWLETGNAGHRDAVLASLRKMLQGGIYDHVGGGLCRYSTDAEWLIPHFEKMLYDNAQLVRLASWAYAQTGEKLFQVRIEETVEWLLREMRLEGGGFASSLDADSEGEEGRFYTWSEEDVMTALGKPEAEEFLAGYELAAPPEWEGKPVIRPRANAISHGALARLREEREKRIRPGRDDKVLSDWNGLTIVALSGAGRLLNRRDWIDAAAEAFRFVCESSDETDRLPHAILGASRTFPALSSDYAAMANAAVALAEATGRDIYAAEAGRLLAQLDEYHADSTGKGHYLTASDSRDTPLRIRGDVDEAVPSATAQIIEAMVRTAGLTGDESLMAKAFETAEEAFGRSQRQRYGQAGIVNACALAAAPSKLVVVEDPAGTAFVPVANRNPDPRRVDTVVRPGDATPVRLPGGTVPDTGTTGAWLCTGQTCLPVITDPAELENALRRRPA